MALGTFTVNKRFGTSGSSIVHYDVSVVGDDSYPAGGTADAESAIRAGIQGADGLAGSLSNLSLLSVVSISTSDEMPVYDAAADKLYVKQISDGAQVSGDQSGTTYRLHIVMG